jgi:hypothetical protein
VLRESILGGWAGQLLRAWPRVGWARLLRMMQGGGHKQQKPKLRGHVSPKIIAKLFRDERTKRAV